MKLALTLLISIVYASVAVFVVPFIATKYGAKNWKQYRWLLAVGSLIALVSWHLPSPNIAGDDTSFSTHFLGGGVFVGFIWLYLKRAFSWRHSLIAELAILFALVSSLGALNELFEVFLHQLGLFDNLWDTSWDILANSLGTLAFYVLYKLWPTKS